jgi:putative endonuclease
VGKPCVYLLANHFQGALYCGVTSNLAFRIRQHREHVFDGFTSKHGIHRLVWFEFQTSMWKAIAREKAIKNWKRAWKIQLIERANPHWLDLASSEPMSHFLRRKLGPGIRRGDGAIQR